MTETTKRAVAHYFGSWGAWAIAIVIFLGGTIAGFDGGLAGFFAFSALLVFDRLGARLGTGRWTGRSP